MTKRVDFFAAGAQPISIIVFSVAFSKTIDYLLILTGEQNADIPSLSLFDSARCERIGIDPSSSLWFPVAGTCGRGKSISCSMLLSRRSGHCSRHLSFGPVCRRRRVDARCVDESQSPVYGSQVAHQVRLRQAVLFTALFRAIFSH